MHAPRRSARRSTTGAAALVLVVLALVGCTRATAGSAEPAAPQGSGPDLGRYYDQQLAWGSCADFAVSDEDTVAFADPAVECARLDVPLDYTAADARTARIAVLRLPATGERIGSLLFNPGGPGVSGISFLPALAASRLTESPVAERFDLVGFDPRGVGASTPTLDCLDDAEWEAERADLDNDPSPAGIEQTEAENRLYAERCSDRSGGPEVLGNVGTRDVVRDLDILRAVLGDEQLSFVGYSYGTRIGSEYAEAFPQRVRALVLDGALDPDETFVDRAVKQNAGFQQAFEAYAADCARSASCPLGTDPARATAAFQALTRPLLSDPLAVGGRRLSYPDAVIGTVQALYAQDFWPILTRGLAGLADGDGRLLLALGDVYYMRAEDGRYANSNEAFVSISCVDEERVTDRAVLADLTRRIAAAAPFRDDGSGGVAALDPCAFWPTGPTSRPHRPQVDGLAPTLVVSTTGDPATPYAAGVDLAAALGGRLLTFEGTRHTVALQGEACVDEIVVDYLVDLALPAEDVRCPPSR